MPDGRIFLKQRGLMSGAKEYPFLQSAVNYFYNQFSTTLQQLKAGANDRIPFVYDIIITGNSSLFVCSKLDFEE